MDWQTIYLLHMLVHMNDVEYFMTKCLSKYLLIFLLKKNIFDVLFMGNVQVIAILYTYPEWPHRQGGCLICWMLQSCRIESYLWLSCTDLHYAQSAQLVLPMRVGGAPIQFDLPSLTPLYVAGCGRLQLGVPHWATSVINWPHILC